MNSDRQVATENATLIASKEIAAIVAERMIRLGDQQCSPMRAAYAMVAAAWKLLEVSQGDAATPHFVEMLRDFADHAEKEYINLYG